MALSWVHAIAQGARAIASAAIEAGGSVLQAINAVTSAFPTINPLAARTIGMEAGGQEPLYQGESPPPDYTRVMPSISYEDVEGLVNSFVYQGEISFEDPRTGEVVDRWFMVGSDHELTEEELFPEAFDSAMGLYDASPTDGGTPPQEVDPRTTLMDVQYILRSV